MTRFFSCLALLLAMVLVGDALAQRRGGSFGGSRSSPSRSYSSPSPSRSYSSPAPSSYQRSSPSSSFGGSRSAPSSSFGGSRSSGSSPSSSLSRSSGSTSPRSYGVPRRESYGGQTYSYKTSGSSAVGVNRSSAMIPRKTNYSYNDVYARRNSYYSGMGFAPPAYIGYTSPSYGMFSTLFMLSALHNLQAQQNAMFFYHHWNTPSMAAWRNDMQQAAQTDPKAAQQIRDLEARIAQLEKENNGVRDTTYMPAGVDSSVVLSNEALGVQDPEVEKEMRRREAEEQRAMASSRNRSSGGGGGGTIGWILLIGAGVGIWWYFRRRSQNSSSGGGSFS